MIDSLEVDSLIGSMTPGQENTGFMLKNKTMELHLRAINSNSKSFWVNQLQKAIDDYDVKTQLKNAEEVSSY
jgi:hypothetical protein